MLKINLTQIDFLFLKKLRFLLLDMLFVLLVQIELQDQWFSFFEYFSVCIGLLNGLLNFFEFVKTLEIGSLHIIFELRTFKNRILHDK